MGLSPRSVQSAGVLAAWLALIGWSGSLAFYQPSWFIGLLERAFPFVLWRVATRNAEVALTFDDGPDPRYTPAILDLLRDHGAKATFFLTARRAEAYPELVARIIAEGHGIGNHLVEDATTLFMSEAQIESAVLEAERVLNLDAAPKYIRPPRIVFSPAFRRVAQRRHYKIVLGSAYVSDPYQPPARYIAWGMVRMLRPGAILVLHDAGGNRSNTVEALPRILGAGRSEGLRFVTLAALEHYPATSS